MKEWRDVSSYSRNDKVRVPSAWQIETPQLRITVHRYVGLDGWYLTTMPTLFELSPLVTADITSAKSEAVQKVSTRLKEMLSGLEEATK